MIILTLNLRYALRIDENFDNYLKKILNNKLRKILNIIEVVIGK
tara:strand:- start:1805 stop:1936 length:132 start_codon:yes stop_codon:yes gene_type:complete